MKRTPHLPELFELIAPEERAKRCVSAMVSMSLSKQEVDASEKGLVSQSFKKEQPT